VNWYEAYAFCIWDGGFLPSEAEWEYAAAGGSQQREYPWGSTSPGSSNQYAIFGPFTCFYPSEASCTGVVNIAPVGTATLGLGLWGQLDLLGNMYQWTMDWYAPYADPCTDCASLTLLSDRECRGSGFDSYYSVVPDRDTTPPAPSSRSARDLGFRCARSP
jgi:formylglycine-generating enzyme required for sulfatase activity